MFSTWPNSFVITDPSVCLRSHRSATPPLPRSWATKAAMSSSPVWCLLILTRPRPCWTLSKPWAGITSQRWHQRATMERVVLMLFSRYPEKQVGVWTCEWEFTAQTMKDYSFNKPCCPCSLKYRNRTEKSFNTQGLTGQREVNTSFGFKSSNDVISTQTSYYQNNTFLFILLEKQKITMQHSWLTVPIQLIIVDKCCGNPPLYFSVKIHYYPAEELKYLHACSCFINVILLIYCCLGFS